MGHVAKAKFGNDGRSKERRDEINDFIEGFADQVDSITAQYVLREIYLKAYDMFPMGVVRNPLHLVAMLPKENVILGSAYQKIFDRYLKYDVYKYTGISFDRFIEQPRHECEIQLSRLVKKQASDNQTGSAIGRELENIVKGNGKYNL